MPASARKTRRSLSRAAPRRNAGRRAGAAERISADRGDYESVRRKASGALQTVPQSGLAVVRSERHALYRRSGPQRACTACPLANLSEYDVRQGRDEPAASLLVDRQIGSGREFAIA